MPGRDGRWSGIGLCVLALSLGVVAPAQAQGPDWQVRQLQGEAGKVMLFGMSCPTPSMCVAVGGNNTLASSTNPTGDISAWDVAYVGEGAVPTAPNGYFNGRQIRGVSCPSPSLCVAVTFEGIIYSSTNPTGGAGAWKAVDLDGKGPNTHMYGVSCPTVNFCAASAGKGRIATSTVPTGDAGDWTVTELDHPVELRGISCPSPSLCVAVGDDGDPFTFDSEVASSTNPLAGDWQSVGLPGGRGGLYGVSCPTPALCASGNLLGNAVVTTNPTGGAAAWSVFAGGGTVQITAASCVTTSRCVLVDNNADLLTSKNPTGGAGAWTFDNLIPYSTDPNEYNANAMFGVSCPSTELCAVAAARGKIITVKAPFAAEPTEVTKTAKKRGKHRKRHRKHRRGPKRPKARLGAQPGPAIRTLNGHARVRFRFFAKGRIRGFECRIDRHRFKTCPSPKGYRLGSGRHVFRVRAVGLTGYRGPAAKVVFTAYTPAQWPPGSPPPNAKRTDTAPS